MPKNRFRLIFGFRQIFIRIFLQNSQKMFNFFIRRCKFIWNEVISFWRWKSILFSYEIIWIISFLKIGAPSSFEMKLLSSGDWRAYYFHMKWFQSTFLWFCSLHLMVLCLSIFMRSYTRNELGNLQIRSFTITFKVLQEEIQICLNDNYFWK